MAKKFSISIVKSNIQFYAEEGQTLKTALFNHGIVIPSACAGNGSCKKCEVIVNGDSVLSCQTIVDKNMVVEIPEDIVVFDICTIEDSKEICDKNEKIAIERIKDVGKTSAYLGEKLCIAVDIGTTAIDVVGVVIDDKFEKTFPQLSGIFEKTNTSAIFDDTDLERISDEYEVEFDNTITELSIDSVVEKAKEIGLQREKGDFFLNAIDLFTKYPIIFDSKILNPQSSLGVDVMSRIDYCIKNGVSKAQNLVIAAINHCLKKLFFRWGLYEIECMVVSGNVAMISMLLGGDVKTLSQFPYSSNYLSVSPKSSIETGLMVTSPWRKRAKVYYDLAPNTPQKQRRDNIDYNTKKIIHFMPAIAPFVGGDFVSGLTLLKVPQEGKYSILVDMGTNTEMGIISRDKIVTTSSPAGPCFEGASISCGMSATRGAIYKFEFDERSNTPVCQVLGNNLPVGICGSGLIDIIAEIRRVGLIDQEGAFISGQKEYKIGAVSLTQADIREYQLAKAAVLTGIELLMQEVGAKEEDIESIYMSGGFSEAISIKSLINSNLLPKNLARKCISIGNSSLYGAINSFRIGLSRAKTLAKKAKYIDMAAKDSFQTTFLSKINFE